jgi:hypothetical protein
LARTSKIVLDWNGKYNWIRPTEMWPYEKKRGITLGCASSASPSGEVLHNPIRPRLASLAWVFYFVRFQTSLKRPNKKPHPLRGRGLLIHAEEEGFEPSVPYKRYAGLANLWFQPLTHPSGQALIEMAPRRCFSGKT